MWVNVSVSVKVISTARQGRSRDNSDSFIQTSAFRSTASLDVEAS